MSLFEERVEAAADETEVEATEKSATYISPLLPSMIRDLYRANLRERSIQNILDLAADLVEELIDRRAADAVVTEEQIAAALHGDACPDDPDEGDTCSCDGADFRRQASVVAALVTGGAK